VKSKRKTLGLPSFLVFLLLFLAACSGEEEPTATPLPAATASEVEAVEEDEEIAEEEAVITNAVVVEDQELGPDSTVTIAKVTADQDSWIVIHAQADGNPGAILGSAPVKAGETSSVVVEIDQENLTEALYAMLHVDAGTAGEFEFPGGDDVPATDASGSLVSPLFNITGGLAAADMLMLAESEQLGSYLTDAAGMTLYTFAIDVPGTSNCYDGCAAAWPPLLIEEGVGMEAAEGISGELGTTSRTDDTLQVTYNGWPLYYWINDEVPGDTLGHNVNNVWAVAYPSTHVFLGRTEELGSFLVNSDGMTLYRFNPDEPGVSNCSDECAANWPPLLVGEGELPRGNAGVVGQLGTTDRDDGGRQVTYEGMPLYLWVNDSVPGDTTGHTVGDVWFVVAPLTVRLSSSDELGDFLVDAGGMTLYLFTVDEEGASSCNDECANAWPPLLIQAGEVPIAGQGVSDDLSVIERDDGTLQVAYKGTPLYNWINDEAPGDTTGHTVNDVWFVVEP